MTLSPQLYFFCFLLLITSYITSTAQLIVFWSCKIPVSRYILLVRSRFVGRFSGFLTSFGSRWVPRRPGRLKKRFLSISELEGIWNPLANRRAPDEDSGINLFHQDKVITRIFPSPLSNYSPPSSSSFVVFDVISGIESFPTHFRPFGLPRPRCWQDRKAG